MKFGRIFLLRNNFKYIAWFFWLIFLANSLTYMYEPLAGTAEDIQKPDYINILITSLTIVALIEGLLTIIIRYFALIRPANKGTYSPYNGAIRFLVVGLINWVCSSSIVVYGSVLFYISGETWPVIMFGGIGLFLLLFHSPRLGAFKKDPEETPEPIDASFSQIK